MAKGKPGPGNCGACRHPRRDMIDLGLICGTPRSVLSQRFGVSEFALGRHASNHLPPTARAAIMAQLAPEAVDLDALQRNESQSLLSSLITQRARLHTMAERAAEDGLHAVAIRAESAILANLELVSRLLGQLVSRHEITTKSYLVTPDYLRLRQVLVQTLRRFPEAARAVAAELATLEDEAVASITAKASPVLIEAQPA
jgi:hypothetical protein